MSKLRYLVICSIALAIGLLSCTEEPAIVAVTSVTLDSTSLTLVEGDNQTLTATVSPSNAENKKVLWSSSNSSVASVKEGVVTALKAGNATITAKTDDGGKTATCTVIVEAKNIPVTGVTLDKTSYEMTEGDEFTLTATVNPENATNKNISWSSSNTSVVSVDNGKVKALKAGTATITVNTEDGDKTATCAVIVNAKIHVESVELDKTSLEISKGESITLKATIYPENATNPSVTWSSSNTSIATVDNGKVTALKAGTAAITVNTEDGNRTAVCEITVTPITVTGIYFDTYSLVLAPGTSYTLTIDLEPSNATSEDLTWSSQNENVAVVNDKGQILAIAEGSTKINATSNNGGAKSCNVRVVPCAEANKDYVDEYGVNHGKGVSVGNVVWAPVNCGYHKSDFKYGKLYQWGRKYGQGRGDKYDESTPEIIEGPLEFENAIREKHSNTFFKNSNGRPGGPWHSSSSKSLWNSGSVNKPVKSEYDPCPEGWRVPTKNELSKLWNNHSNYENVNGQKGYYFSGQYTYTDESPKVFMISAGYRQFDGDVADHEGYYWSSEQDDDFSTTYILNSGWIGDMSHSISYGCSLRCVQE